MLLRQMKYFTAVIDCNSFTEAAQQCYISQSAISQQIQSLEKELGVELIHRENRRFTVTPTGQYFYSHCKAILGQVEDLIRETKRLGQDRELQLRIGYLRCYSGMELYQAVAEFSGLYPEVSINIVNGTHEELYDLLRFGGSYLFADNLEEGRLMVLSNRGFLPVESVGTLPPAGLSIKRLPICRGGRQVMRNYCAFWRKDQSNYYIEEFADILRKLMTKEQDSD